MEYRPREPMGLSEPVMQAMVAASIDHHAIYKGYTLRYTAKGSNTSTKVARCNVKFNLHGCEKAIQVYVKAWPGTTKTHFINEMTKFKMDKEAYFYQFILPSINNELSRIGAGRVNCVKYLYYHQFYRSQALFLDEAKGYEALDRHATFTLNHALVATAELARLHAGSVLIMRKDEKFVKITEMEDVLNDFINNKRSGLYFEKLFLFYAQLADERKLPKILEFFVRFKQFGKLFLQTLLRCDLPFLVLCHGGPWIKDILYSHDAQGEPDGCMLIDFQCARFGSFALDLVYLVYVNLEPEIRVTNLQTILDTYYDTFSSVLEKEKIQMPFNRIEMEQEFTRKLFFGLYSFSDMNRNLWIETRDCLTVDDYMLKDFTELTEDQFTYFTFNINIRNIFEIVLKELEKSKVFDYGNDENLKGQNTNSIYYTYRLQCLGVKFL